jgi:hypothetical protein
MLRFLIFALLLFPLVALAAPPVGVPVSYTLPTTGALPQTYRVTLAIVEAKNPEWIISQFVCGQPRTVTADNGGKFTEHWDGLDDNFMPVPPGTYGVKGIVMPASKWPVDGEYHSVVPRFVGGPSVFLPTPEQVNRDEPFGGDPCGAPLGDIDVGPNGVGVFYYVYLENGLNNPLIDLKKPLGIEQFVRAFGSGGAGGGTSTCTDGETVWSFSTDGGPKYVYRADGKPFGTGRAQRPNVYRPAGWVQGMSCLRDAAAGKSFVYIAQRGKIIETKEWPHFAESATEFVDAVTVHAGEGGTVLATVPVQRPLAVAARGGKLYVLHGEPAGGYSVSVVSLQAGLPQGEPVRLFTVPRPIVPADLEVDSTGRLYLSDSKANKVFQLTPQGVVLRSYGRLEAQNPGTYDPLTLIEPGKLATWVDSDGNDRLLIVEMGGPNRVSEWSADGKLLREFQSLQTKANDGYAVDPERPEHVYIAGHRGWLTRFKVEYATGKWTVNAVWPHVGDDPKAPHLDHPQCLVVNGRKYLACGRSNNIYRQAGDRWLLSAAIIREQKGNESVAYSWHDANGDGAVQEAEYRTRSLATPGWLYRYHGNQWLADLSLVALNQGGPDVWRLAPAGFDAHGNPIFDKWERLFTDPVFTARATGTATALFGGNEMADKYHSDWAMVDGSMADGFFVTARGGPSFSANEGGQVKHARYVPDGKGGYRLLWRTGRQALFGVARPGESYGTTHLNGPLNGLVAIIDQSRCGVLLYTTDGLYVDTLFPDGRRFSPSVAGLYPQPGEFFAGFLYPNTTNGRIYCGLGKISPLLFVAEGWSLTENPAKPLLTVQKLVTIGAPQIASPPEIALTMRGGAGAAKVARFAPALGGAVLDGSLAGWESCEPIRMQGSAEQTVEVRALYDPEHLYLRWHARLGAKVDPKALQPTERLFTHDRQADTLSLYIQGDQQAKPGGLAGGRAGDVRMIFALVTDDGDTRPVVLGLYPAWTGAKAIPVTYRTPVGQVTFAHVGLLPEVALHHLLDADGKGFVLTAAIPRSAIPGLPALGSTTRTMINFEATFGGRNKFWWANADGSASRETLDEPTEARLYPGSWAPAQFQGLTDGVLVRNWLVCGPFGGPGAEKFTADLGGVMPGTNKDYKQAGREFCEAQSYPPDTAIEVNADYRGALIQGYWRDPGVVRWRLARVDDLDTRVLLGPSAQTWYAATWVHVPVDTELDFRFQGHPQTYYRWLLNGQSVFTGEIRGEVRQAVQAKTLTLRAGWNELRVRTYCVGYPSSRGGLVFVGPAEKLWTLRLATQPPK